MPVEVATDWVIQAAKLPAIRADLKMTTKQLEIDAVMQQTVTEKLKCETEHA